MVHTYSSSLESHLMVAPPSETAGAERIEIVACLPSGTVASEGVELQTSPVIQAAPKFPHQTVAGSVQSFPERNRF